MAISKKRSEEIKKFKNKDFSDCPKLTNAQLKQMKPCHLLDRDLWKPQKKVMSIRIDVDVLQKGAHRVLQFRDIFSKENRRRGRGVKSIRLTARRAQTPCAKQKRRNRLSSQQSLKPPDFP